MRTPVWGRFSMACRLHTRCALKFRDVIWVPVWERDRLGYPYPKPNIFLINTLFLVTQNTRPKHTRNANFGMRWNRNYTWSFIKQMLLLKGKLYSKGYPFWTICPMRGLQQGDLLSQYPYILHAEVLAQSMALLAVQNPSSFSTLAPRGNLINVFSSLMTPSYSSGQIRKFL